MSILCSLFVIYMCIPSYFLILQSCRLYLGSVCLIPHCALELCINQLHLSCHIAWMYILPVGQVLFIPPLILAIEDHFKEWRLLVIATFSSYRNLLLWAVWKLSMYLMHVIFGELNNRVRYDMVTLCQNSLRHRRGMRLGHNHISWGCSFITFIKSLWRAVSRTPTNTQQTCVDATLATRDKEK